MLQIQACSTGTRSRKVKRPREKISLLNVWGNETKDIPKNQVYENQMTILDSG
jgi:hypothetical protein